MLLVSALPLRGVAADLELSPAVWGIILDSNPQNGVGEETFEGFFGIMNRNGRQDRAIAEFDITSLTSAVDSATFSSGSIGSDTTGSMTMQLWGYVGDGAVSVGDWFSGTELQDTFGNGLNASFVVDVTAYVNGRIAAEDASIGFAARQTSVQVGRKDWVDPILILVPEPSPAKLGMTALGTLLLLQGLRVLGFREASGRRR